MTLFQTIDCIIGQTEQYHRCKRIRDDRDFQSIDHKGHSHYTNEMVQHLETIVFILDNGFHLNSKHC